MSGSFAALIKACNAIARLLSGNPAKSCPIALTAAWRHIQLSLLSMVLIKAVKSSSFFGAGLGILPEGIPRGKLDDLGLVWTCWFWLLGAANVLPRPQLPKSHRINNTLAVNWWPWVYELVFLVLFFMILKVCRLLPRSCEE